MTGAIKKPNVTAPVQASTNPAIVGKWNPTLIQFKTVPLPISLLPNGKILYWGRDKVTNGPNLEDVTGCQSTCPAMNARLKKLQADLGERLGKDVFIVTVTKDPEMDTPSRLKAFGNNLKIKPGWTMITGDVKTIGKIVFDFTGDRLGQDSHNSIFIIGNDKTGSWADFSGYASIDELRQQIYAVK